MVVLITLSLLIIASLALAVLRLMRRPPSYAWLAAVMGAFFAWGSMFFWQFSIPTRLVLSGWSPVSLFDASPNFWADSYAWLYALSLAALSAAVILTSPARFSVLSPVSWMGSLTLAVVAFLAVMADNILTLVLAWTAVDILEFLNTLRLSKSPSMSERAVIAFSFRAAGTGTALWAGVLASTSGQLSTLEAIPSSAQIFLLLAVGLRLGVLPLHLATGDDRGFRRGFGSTLRLTVAATSLVVLARLPSGLVIDARYLPFLLAFTALAALYSSWKWLSIPDEINARPFWIIGMSALSLSAALRGSPTGSAAWGAALILFGGLSFLYSSRQTWFTRLFAGLALFLFALPLTLTSTGWMGDFPFPIIFWPLFLSAHLMLVAGYLRHLFHTGDTRFEELPRWAQAAYPIGMGTLVITIIISGLWGWPGSWQIGAWVIALILLALAGAAGIVFRRLEKLVGPQSLLVMEPLPWHISPFLQQNIGRFFWGTYRFLARIAGYLASLMEGDGGLLWTLLLLVLFIIILRGR